MGKSKARILRKGINNQFSKIRRQDAVLEVADALNNSNIEKAIDLITMFCLSAEEVLEAGANYESVISIKNIFTK